MTSATPSSLLAVPDRALMWLDRHARLLQRALIAAAVVALVLWQAHAVAGTPGLVLFGSAAAAIGGLLVGRRRAPQATGTVASTLASITTVMIATTATNPLWVVLGVGEIAIVYPALFAVIAALAWVMPSTGVHRGWTTTVGQGALLVSLVPALAFAGTGYSAAAVFGGAALAVLIVGLRIKKVPSQARPTGWRRAIRTSVMGLIVGLLAMTSALAAPAPAAASPISAALGKVKDATFCQITQPNLAPEPVGTGPEGMFANINFGQAEARDGSIPRYADQAVNFTRTSGGGEYGLDSYTLYEVSGLRGLKWVNWQKDAEGDPGCNIMSWMSVMVGNLSFKFTTYALQTTLAFKEWSQDSNPMELLYTEANPIVNSIFVHFLAPMGAVMMTIAGITLGVRASREGGLRQGLGEIGASLLVFVLAAFMFSGVAVASFANPQNNGFYTVASIFDNIAAGLNNAIAEAVFSVIDDGGEGSMCYRPEGSEADSSPVAPGQRITSCILAESLAYKPWALGQFGAAGAGPIETTNPPTRFSDPSLTGPQTMERGDDDDTTAQGVPCYNNVGGCADLRVYLIAQSGGPDITGRMSSCLSGGGGPDTGDDEPDYDVLARCEPYHAVAAELYKQSISDDPATSQQGNSLLASYRGDGAMPHVAQSFASVIGVLVVGVGLGSMGIITLGWHAWLFVLFLMGLFQLVWGAFPGKSKVAQEWVQGVVSAFTQRILYGVAMTLMIWVISVVFSAQVNTGIKVLWSVLVLVGTWMLIRKIQTLAAEKAPNMARYGTLAGAAPAAAVGYAGMKAGKAAGSAAVRAVPGAARGTARATRVAGVGAARGGATAAKRGGEVVAGSRLGSVYDRTANNVGGRMDGAAAAAGNRDRPLAVRSVGQVIKTGRTVKEGTSIAASATRQATGGLVAKSRDGWNQSAKAQWAGKQPGAHATAHSFNAEEAKRERAARSERRENIRKMREERESQRAKDRRTREFTNSSNDFGLGSPINRPNRPR